MHLFRILVLIVFAVGLASCGGDPIETASSGADDPMSEDKANNAGVSDDADAETDTRDTADTADTSSGSDRERPDAETDASGNTDAAQPTVAPQPTATALPKATSGDRSGDEAVEDESSDEGVEDEVVVDGSGWQRVDSNPDLVDAYVLAPDEVILDADGRTVLVRFWNGVEPCSAANVILIEGPDRVEVVLKAGVHPDGASMTCIAVVAAYEIAEPLAEPLGDRELIVAQPNDQGAVPDVPDVPDTDPTEPPPLPQQPVDPMFVLDQYLGLTLAEAEDLATVEGREFRIGRIDDEWIPVTSDYRESRVTVELEEGIVVAAVVG